MVAVSAFSICLQSCYVSATIVYKVNQKAVLQCVFVCCLFSQVFVSLSSWQAAHQKRSRKGAETQEREKDENYISYSASDSHSEKG